MLEARSNSLKMAEVVPITTPIRVLQEDHEGTIMTVAVFPGPHGQRMVTRSGRMLRLWDLEGSGIVLKGMEGHRSDVRAVAVSRDGWLIASGDEEGKLIAWLGTTGEPVPQSYECIDAHSKCICALDFSPDGAMMASGSLDQTIKLWSTKTWQVQGDPIQCSDLVCCVRYSPSGEFLAIATDLNIAIYNPSMREFVANLRGPLSSDVSLAWAPDSSCLLSAGNHRDSTIREWDTSTWTQVGDPWTGHTEGITAIAVNFAGTMIASASHDNHVRLWQRSNRRTIAIFKHSNGVNCVTFSMDGRHILCSGGDKKISEWKVEVVHRALIVAVDRAPDFRTLSLARRDALRMRYFLVKSRDYLPENITIMMHHPSIPEKHYPSRNNILREIDFIVLSTSPHDYLLFYYSGYGEQVAHKHDAGRQNEAIVSYTGKRITNKVLKKRLVNPLPEGAKLFVRVLIYFIMIIILVIEVLTTSFCKQALWDCSNSHTMLDLEHHECNELWSAPSKVLSGLGRKNKSSGEGPSAKFLKDSSDVQSSVNNDSQIELASLITDSMGLGPRASSPAGDTYLPACTGNCPLTLQEEQVMTHVVSLSACRDDETAYDDNRTGETVTKFFVDYLERNPKASYHDLLSYMRHNVDGITLRRRAEKNKINHQLRLQKSSEGEVEEDNEDSNLKSQRPWYSSRYRLDMLQMVDL
ncbi:WD40 repeat-like protein [Suillus decipiens]|nr:WD40 repeat-like protein [Suillus decipiens]